MGGKASKVLKETTLVTCNTHGDGSKFPVICGSPVSDRIKGIEGDKSGCYTLGGKQVVNFKVVASHGMKKKHSTIVDADGKVKAYVITKSGLAKRSETIILKKLPSYDGQEPVDPEMLEKSYGIEKDVTLYDFAKIEKKKTGLSTSTASYSIVFGGEGQYKQLYEAEKLNSMGFHCIVRVPGGDAVATADQTNATSNVVVNVAEGVDLAAVLLTGQCTHSDALTTGAMAGKAEELQADIKA